MFKMKQNFNELIKLITEKGRSGQKRLDLNTYVMLNRLTGCIEIHYFNHPIIVIKPDNSFSVSNHGWPISDVRELINKFTNLNIQVKRGVWYIGDKPFYNDITFQGKLNSETTSNV